MEGTQKQFSNERPAKILLVDDESSNRFLMRDMLTKNGYEIVEAENGRIALEAASKENPDTILLDVMMPEMDGFETCRRLKENETTTNIPVLMASALSDRANRLEGITAGAVDFITKPVDIRDLLARVEHAVAGKRQVEDLSETCQRLTTKTSNHSQKLAKVSHDMRSPLAAMMGNLQLLQMIAGDKFTTEETEILQNSLDASDSLLKHIESLTESDETLVN